MSDAKRLYNLVRGYVGREWERIQDLERKMAQDELNSSAPSQRNSGQSRPTPPAPADGSQPTQIFIPEGTDPKETARKVLDVAPDADFREIRRAFVRMNRRSESAAFEPGTPEARQAEDLRRKVQWAYQKLTAETPDIEKRFRSLEID
jgi:hypothetical protein